MHYILLCYSHYCRRFVSAIVSQFWYFVIHQLNSYKYDCCIYCLQIAIVMSRELLSSRVLVNNDLSPCPLLSSRSALRAPLSNPLNPTTYRPKPSSLWNVSEIILANKRISNHAVSREDKTRADKQTFPSFRQVVRPPAVPNEILPGVQHQVFLTY